jgi:negative regulator of sigma E activity
MTTTVKVTAHCTSDKHVRITKKNLDGTNYEHVTIRDGETHELVVYDDWSVTVREEVRPALTDADAAADLAGTPRPDHPTGASD